MLVGLTLAHAGLITRARGFKEIVRLSAQVLMTGTDAETSPPPAGSPRAYAQATADSCPIRAFR
jgi:hypothetical protein